MALGDPQIAAQRAEEEVQQLGLVAQLVGDAAELQHRLLQPVVGQRGERLAGARERRRVAAEGDEEVDRAAVLSEHVGELAGDLRAEAVTEHADA